MGNRKQIASITPGSIKPSPPPPPKKRNYIRCCCMCRNPDIDPILWVRDVKLWFCSITCIDAYTLTANAVYDSITGEKV